jgi:glycosyltransferase involved in cell wall biosynthesis
MRFEGPIYIEASPLLTQSLAGIGRFAARLVEGLMRHCPVRLFNTIQGDQAKEMALSEDLPCGYDIAVEQDPSATADRDLGKWIKKLLRGRLLQHDMGLANKSAGLYTMLRPPERHFRRELCLIHDFTPLLMPWAHVPQTCDRFGRFFEGRAASCDQLIANSCSTRSDAGWLCGVPEKDVVLGYPGPTLCARMHAHPYPVARDRRIILVVSTLEPRKNGRFLVEWFLNTDVLDPDTELWWVGPNGWLFDVSPREVERSERGRNIKWLGVVSDSRLCELYQQAAFTIYPSLYEGFGFPVLDSLRHGTPVASSYHSSLKEFAGPGVYYFDPCDAGSLDAACTELKERCPDRLLRADLDRRFSWDQLARNIVELCAA